MLARARPAPQAARARCERKRRTTMGGDSQLVKYKMWIGGEWVDAASGETFPSDNPYLGKPWALIPKGGAEDADRAVRAAHKALTSGPWPKMTASQRGALLRK